MLQTEGLQLPLPAWQPRLGLGTHVIRRWVVVVSGSHNVTYRLSIKFNVHVHRHLRPRNFSTN
jgi:hypothetical protein